MIACFMAVAKSSKVSFDGLISGSIGVRMMLFCPRGFAPRVCLAVPVDRKVVLNTHSLKFKS